MISLGGTMRILGIDPGIAILGYGIIDVEGNKLQLVSYGAIITTKDMTTPLRLREIERQLKQILEEYKPDEIVFEELFFQNNAKTAFIVGAARGVAVCVCAGYRPDKLFEYTPPQIKQAVTGYGKADKQQVQQMVKLILNLEKIPKPDDAADAVAAAIAHANSGKQSFIFSMK